MNTAEIRHLAKESIKGKHFKACVIILIYLLLTMLIAMVPIVGSIGSIVLSIPFSYGLVYTMIKLKRNENVGYFDFVSTAFSNFGNAWKVAFSMLGKLWPYLLAYVLLVLVLTFSIAFFGTGIAISQPTANELLNSNGFTSTPFLIALFITIIIFSIACIVIYVLFILKSLYYSLSYYVLYDNSSLTGKEIVEQSHTLMKGNRWNFVKMQIPYYLAYIGIVLLVSILAGIISIASETTLLMVLLYVFIYCAILYILPLIQFAIIEFYEKVK